ncbi:MAG: 2-amino-4-hydroxy-6-hydroxymethyldihydropteridine diphosphokinase [Chitinophagales bacterium]
MKTVILSLGTNVGNRQLFLENALLSIVKNIGKVVKKSSLYESAAWGEVATTDFLNQVLVVQTEKMPSDVLSIVLQIEKDAGRERNEKWGDRTLDIDILFYEKWIIESEKLIVPHPFLQERRFILAPLYEILPDFEHPVLRKNVKDLFDICADKLAVKRFSPNE